MEILKLHGAPLDRELCLLSLLNTVPRTHRGAISAPANIVWLRTLNITTLLIFNNGTSIKCSSNEEHPPQKNHINAPISTTISSHHPHIPATHNTYNTNTNQHPTSFNYPRMCHFTTITRYICGYQSQSIENSTACKPDADGWRIVQATSRTYISRAIIFNSRLPCLTCAAALARLEAPGESC